MNKIPSTVLTIPAKRYTPQEKVLTIKPWFLRESKEAVTMAPPPILTFTKSEFIADFFAGVEQSGKAFNATAFETLIPFRDYAEPPRGMLDSGGNPLYPVPPAGGSGGGKNDGVTQYVARLKPGPQKLKSWQAFDDFTPDNHNVPDAKPAWFRKLYLPLHQHFQIVTTEVVCRHLGQYPRLGERRVAEAGMIVRRLVDDPNHQRWEDWISGPNGKGVWLEIADRAMRPLIQWQEPPPPVDPLAIGSSLDALKELEVRSALGLAAEDPLPEQLSVHKLSLLPGSIGKATQHTAFFGYLPLQSSELQTPSIQAKQKTLKDLRMALASGARNHLRAELLGEPPEQLASEPKISAFVKGVRQRIQKPLRQLASVLILPDAPDEETLKSAQKKVLNEAGRSLDNPNDLKDLNQDVALILSKAMLANAESIAKTIAPAGETSWWSEVDTKARSTAIINQVVHADIKKALAKPGLAKAVGDLLKTRIYDIVDRFAPQVGAKQGKSVPDADVHRVLATLLLRLRSARKKLAETLYSKIFAGQQGPDLNAKEDGSTFPEVTVGSLSDELTAWVRANDKNQRKIQPQSWDHVSIRQDWADAHEAGAKLEAVLNDINARGSGAGVAYNDGLNEKTKEVGKKWAESITGHENLDTLRELGLDVRNQPELGLMIHPTFAPTKDTLEDFIDTVAVRYENVRTVEQLRAEESGKMKPIRARFDSESLYAVWCFVRVTGRNACEKEQILWTLPSDVFSLAEPTDILGVRPVPIQMPDLNKLVRDIPRIARAEAAPYAAVKLPPNSNVTTGDELDDTERKWGIGEICTFGIPVFTICAWVLFMIIFAILSIIPGFVWMLLLKFCIPVPGRR